MSQGTHNPQGRCFASSEVHRIASSDLENLLAEHQNGATNLSTHMFAREATFGCFLDKIMGFGDIS